MRKLPLANICQKTSFRNTEPHFAVFLSNNVNYQIEEMKNKLTLTLKKSISDQYYSVKNDRMIKIIYKNIMTCRPKNIKIKDENEILIRNYFMEDYEEWERSDHIVIGTDPWALILKAKIDITTNNKNKTKSINYHIDFILSSIFMLVSTLVFGLITVWGFYHGFGSIIQGLKIAAIFSLFWIMINIWSIYYFQVSKHREILQKSIEEIKTFANNSLINQKEVFNNI